MNSIVNLKDGFITFNSNIDYSLSFSKCGIGYSNYNINSYERGSLVFLTNNNADTTNINLHSDIRMCIASDGNVGIGTNNPNYKLDIQGGAAQTLRILDTRAVGDAIVALKELNDNNGFDMAYIGTTGDKFYIRGYNNSATPRVDFTIDRITSNVGIGMTDPKYKLDVAGTINASNILINGSIISASSSQWITSGTNMYNNNTGNVGIGTNNNIQSKLTINPIVTDNSGFNHSEAPLTITNPTPTSSSVLNDPKSVLHLCRQGTGNQAHGARASFKLCRYENSTTNSRTRLDITLAHNSYDDINTMSITSGGNVGIGTNNPSCRLQVGNGGQLRIANGDQDYSLIGTITDEGQYNTRIVVSGNNRSGIFGRIEYFATTGDHMFFTTYNSTERMRIANNGNVGIGTNNPSAYTLQVNGTIGASGNITASYSDERLKNITEYVSDVLPILNKINVFKYNCNDLAASYGYDKNKKEIGLSAQEVQKYYPEVVSIAPFDSEYDEETKNITSKSGKNYLTLDYERLVPILLQGIKDLNNKVVEMEENEIHMKNELNNIKSRLDKLELI